MSINHQKVARRSGLYTLVFASVYARVLALLMLGFFILQPLTLVYAAEEEVADSAAVSASEAPEIVAPEPTESTELPPESTDEPAAPSDLTENEAQDTTDTLEVPEVETVSEDPIPSEDDEIDPTVPAVPAETGTGSTSPSTSSDDAPPPFAVSTTSAASTTLENDSEDPLLIEGELLSEPVVEDPLPIDEVSVPPSVASEKSESTVPISPLSTEVPEPTHLEVKPESYHSDNLYQFDRSQCVAVGDGSYHCFDVTGTALAEASTEVVANLDDGGDYEIYRISKRGREQVTNNRLDDTAPMYDPVSDTIVWQRLETGTYSIYADEQGAEVVLSEDGVNSMEPHRSGQYVVWQSWIDGDWDVVLWHGGHREVISTSAAQDVAPHVQGNYVIWTTTNGAERTVSVYDIETGEASTINDADGARVENPRFVLVYDSKFDNGDIITKGYDAETGEVVPLAAQTSIPVPEIPPSDQTGETRALLQVKTPSREEVEPDLQPQSSGSGEGATPPTLASSTDSMQVASSTQHTIDMAVTVPAEALATTTLPLTDFDIIVEPYSTTTSAHESGSATTTNRVE